MMFWRCEALVAPYLYIRSGAEPKTKWTPKGEEAYAKFRKEEIKKQKGLPSERVLLRPGVHYTVVPSNDTPPTYFVFPDHEKLTIFRSAWILVRNRRPHVPVIEGCPLPSSDRQNDDAAKYCSVFFRPWTLLEGSADVPELRLLGTRPEQLRRIYEQVATQVAPKRRLVRRSTPIAPLEFRSKDSLQWQIAWDEYVHGTPGPDGAKTGNVVSEHARRLIQTFLTNTLGKTQQADDEDQDADGSDADPEIPPLVLNVDEARQVLHSGITKDLLANDDGQEIADKEKPEEQKGTRKQDLRRRIHASTNRRSAELWRTDDAQDNQQAERALDGPMHGESATSHLQARRENHDKDEEVRPYAGATAPKAGLYKSTAARSIDDWIASVRREKNPPNAQQLAFLEALATRLKTEIAEELGDSKTKTKQEPLLDLVHGLPGTGKTRVIQWMRRLFEEALGWTHGVQFVMLAFQNSMAAHIDGLTIHHWAGIPVNAEAGRSGTKNATKMSTQCQCLRFIIIDEISMVSAELLGQLENIVSKVIRTRASYKIRASDRAPRAFGGVNVILLGDWWQLQPVRSTALFGYPKKNGVAGQGLNLLWKTGLDTIRGLWELTQPMRCDDTWYNEVLGKCRHGHLDLETYCLLHGLPTSTPASFDVREQATDAGAAAPSVMTVKGIAKPPGSGIAGCQCSNDVELVSGTTNVYCKRAWATLFLQGWSGRDIVCRQPENPHEHAECSACAAKRKQCKRVLPHGPVKDRELQEEPFASAPAIYSYNLPKYYAMHLRAREFARVHRQKLSWIIARDVPLFSEDRALEPPKLRAKLCKWLLNHDQKTKHITSIMPLVKGLPVRLTESIERQRGLFRNRCGSVGKSIGTAYRDKGKGKSC